jgi:uncharacterized membrane protein YgdD (TMEM256/DUF423 family)
MNITFKLACYLTALGIAAQAFGHHGLRSVLSESHLGIFETASRYILLSGIWFLALLRPSTLPQRPLKLIFAGVVVFSGSLVMYLITKSAPFMMITPIGGLGMIVGFVYLGVTSTSPSND